MNFIKNVCDDCWKGQNNLCYYPELCMKKALDEERERQQVEMGAKTMQSLTAFSDLYFSHQLKRAKGNAAAEKEIRKKQFNLNKAFGT